jgi:soluble lytic murein transglycosylase-like protein
LACQIRAGEVVLRDPAADARALAEAGANTELAYRRLAERPAWDAPVLADLGSVPRRHVEHAVAAQRELTSLAGSPRDTLPAWRVEEPRPLGELRAFYDEAQRRFGVPWPVLAAIHLVETRMGRVVGLSVAGAQGPMQFMPGTWSRYGMGGDVWSPRDAILGAANYLSANGGAQEASLDRALRRYNNDVRYVRAVRHYAEMIAEDPVALVGVYAWPVRYRSTVGDLLLPVGYSSTRSVSAREWLASQPR